MLKKISFLIKILIFFFISTSNIFSVELTIIPLKKPILDKTSSDERVVKDILKPKSKPKEAGSDEIQEKLKIVEKKEKEKKFLQPKNKPLIVKKELIKKQEKLKIVKKKRKK